MTIIVKNLPPQITEADLIELFSEFGSSQVKLAADKNSASVEPSDAEEEDVLKALNGKAWHGKNLELEIIYDGGDRDPDGPP